MSTELTLIAMSLMVLSAFGSLAWWGYVRQRQADRENGRLVERLAVVTGERDRLLVLLDEALALCREERAEREELAADYNRERKELAVFRERVSDLERQLETPRYAEDGWKED